MYENMIDNKQFIISKIKCEWSEWKSLDLINGYILNYHQNLRIVHNNDNSVVLLGYAWQIVSNLMSPDQYVLSSSISVDNVYDIEHTWCGRYVLIMSNKVYLDATGLLGVFYDFKNEVISSSIHVMNRLLRKDDKYPKIYHSILPDFVPGRLTVHSEYFRLLPSQVLNYCEKSILLRPLCKNQGADDICEQDRDEKFINLYTTSLHNMANLFKDYRIKHAITGGHDSRTTLAFLEHAGIDYSLFTLEYPEISYADRVIPLEVSNVVGKRLQFINRKYNKFSLKNYLEYKKHCSGMAVDQDWLFYSFKQYQELTEEGEKVLIIRSSIWECVIEYFEKYVDENEDIDEKSIKKFFRGNNYIQLLNDSTNDWFNMIKSDKINNLSIANRILWELRSGCWLSSIEQSLDIIENIEFIQPTNCREFLSILLSYDRSQRIEKVHQDNMVAKITLQLALVPFEVHNDSNKQNSHRIIIVFLKFLKLFWCLSHMGIKSTYDYMLKKKK